MPGCLAAILLMGRDLMPVLAGRSRGKTLGRQPSSMKLPSGIAIGDVAVRQMYQALLSSGVTDSQQPNGDQKKAGLKSSPRGE